MVVLGLAQNFTVSLDMGIPKFNYVPQDFLKDDIFHGAQLLGGENITR